MSEKQFDVVLYGATGFTGRQTAQYFAQFAPEELRWAIAGRSKEKLIQIRQSLGPAAARVGLIVADSSRPESVETMVKSTRVLLTTAGPFALYGEPVVRACALHGVDYVDITGETPFVRRMIDLYESDAIRSGAKIIHFCGFDSIPSDICSFLAVQYFRDNHRLMTHRAKAFFQLAGALNGGTLASGLAMNNANTLAQLHDPVLLSRPGLQTDAERRVNLDVKQARFDADLNGWALPFFMAPMNTRVVRRSRSLFAQWGQDYGPHFQYQEYLKLPRGGRVVAHVITALMGALEPLMGSAAGRWLIQTFGPRPGEGPTEAQMDGGYFKTVLFADGEVRPDAPAVRVKVTMSDQGDPGNRATVKMLCECALALATQRAELPGGQTRAGFLTPATGLGMVLVERLKARGMKLTVEAYETPWKNLG